MVALLCPWEISPTRLKQQRPPPTKDSVWEAELILVSARLIHLQPCAAVNVWEFLQDPVLENLFFFHNWLGSPRAMLR